MHLVDQIKEKAKKNLQTVVLPESYDDREEARYGSGCSMRS